MSVFATAPRQQPQFPGAAGANSPAAAAGSGAAAGLNRFATVSAATALSGGVGMGGSWSNSSTDGVAGGGVAAGAAAATTAPGLGAPGSLLTVSSASSLSSVPPGPGGTAADTAVAGDLAPAGEALQQPWVSVGGSWRDEENVCGYWRFSEGAAVVGELEEGKQVQYGVAAG